MKLSVNDLIILGVLKPEDRDGFLIPNKDDGFLVLYNGDKINYIYKNAYDEGSWIVCPHDDDGEYSFSVKTDHKMEGVEIYQRRYEDQAIIDSVLRLKYLQVEES